MLPKISLTVKSVILIVVILLSGVGMVLLQQNYVKGVVEEEIFNNLVDSSSSTERLLSGYLEGLQRNVEQLSVSADIKNSLINREYDSANELLHEVAIGQREVLHIDLIDINGKVVASSLSSKIGGDKSESDIFLKGRSNAFFNPIHFASSTGEPAFGIVVPVLQNGETIGLVLGDYSASVLYELLAEGGQGEVNFLVNDEGVLVSPHGQDNNVVLEREYGKEYYSECVSHSHDVHGDVLNASLYKSIDGVEVAYSHELIEFPGWCLVVEIERDQILLPLNSVLRASFSITLLSAGLGVLVILFVHRSIVLPVRRLQKGVDRIRQGELDFRFKRIGKDEFGGLSNAINEMAEAVKKSQVGLKQQVDERTKDLQRILSSTEEQNKSLAENKMAMLNLLEDQRELQEELERSKTDVEKQVEQRTRELNLERSRSLSVIENTADGIVITDNEGKVDYVNPSFERITGHTYEDLHKKIFAEVLVLYDLNMKEIPVEQRSDAAALTKARSERKAIIKVDENEVRLAVSVSTSPYKLGNEFAGVVRVFHDITEDVRLQRLKDDFFSIASHELRTPLTVIAGNIDMLLNGGISGTELDEKDKLLLGDSAEAADRLIKLVNDFLNVSRLDQGRLKYELSEIDICDLTDNVVRELEPLAKKKNIYLKYECSKDHGAILGDEGLVKEILINLIGNSMKFTSEGGITVSHESEGELVKVRVVDTGIGIDENNQGKLFQRFQQAMERTLSREAGGTGLGLYISREFARRMGGDLVLEHSALGEGSTFSVHFVKINSKKAEELLKIKSEEEKMDA